MSNRTRLIVVAGILFVFFIAIAALSLAALYQAEPAFTLFDQLNLSHLFRQFSSDGQFIAGSCNVASGGNCGT
jgi:hypothetical protein